MGRARANEPVSAGIGTMFGTLAQPWVQPLPAYAQGPQGALAARHRRRPAHPLSMRTLQKRAMARLAHSDFLLPATMALVFLASLGGVVGGLRPATAGPQVRLILPAPLPADSGAVARFALPRPAGSQRAR